MSSKIMNEFMFEVPELVPEIKKSKDRKIFCYLAIFENQLLCWAMDHYWFCESHGDVCSYNNNYRTYAFHRKMEIVFKNAAQCYIKRDFRNFYEYCDRILNMQNEIVKYKLTVLLILNKHYQYKNSYQGKCDDPKNVYGDYCLDNINKKNHLMVFSNFDKNNGYKRFVYTF